MSLIVENYHSYARDSRDGQAKKRRMMSIAKCFYTARACNGAFNPEALEGSFDGLRKYGENP